MKILFELSGEHPTLPLAEAMACMKAEGIDFKEVKKGRIFIVDADVNDEEINKIARRISLCHTINEVIALGTKEEIFTALSNYPIKQKFKIEGRKFKKEGSISYLKKEFGELLAKNAKVDLQNPDVIFRIFIEDSVFFCRKISSIERKSFEQRKPQNRPFSSPISIHPKFARAIVNLSQLKKGETLLDPFCGTGGILIEAGLIGAKVIGIDVKKKIIEGCKKNLDYYGIKNYELYAMDMREACIEKVDCIVSDFPYGRSTYTGGELHFLYDKAFEKMKEWVKEGGKAVIGLPSKEFIDIGKKYFKLKEVHPLRVHKSLTRYFCVYLETKGLPSI